MTDIEAGIRNFFRRASALGLRQKETDLVASPPAAATETDFQGPINYKEEPGKIYRLVGAENDSELLSSCSDCGAPFPGALAQACLHCGNERTAYKVLDEPEEGQVEHIPQTEEIHNDEDDGNIEKIVLPEFGDGNVEVGRECLRQRILGSEVVIGPLSKITAVGAKSAKIGADCQIDFLVADDVYTNWGYQGRGLLGTIISIGSGSKVDTVVVLDYGMVTLHARSEVGELVIGNDVDLILKEGVTIKKLLYLGTPARQEMGEKVTIKEESLILWRQMYIRRAHLILSDVK